MDIIYTYYISENAKGTSNFDVLEAFSQSKLFNYSDILNGINHQNNTLNMFIESCNRTYGIPRYQIIAKDRCVWTISQKFRDDLTNIFYKSSDILIELGCHYGYTTGFLSNLVKSVIA